MKCKIALRRRCTAHRGYLCSLMSQLLLNLLIQTCSIIEIVLVLLAIFKGTTFCNNIKMFQYKRLKVKFFWTPKHIFLQCVCYVKNQYHCGNQNKIIVFDNQEKENGFIFNFVCRRSLSIDESKLSPFLIGVITLAVILLSGIQNHYIKAKRVGYILFKCAKTLKSHFQNDL